MKYLSKYFYFLQFIKYLSKVCYFEWEFRIPERMAVRGESAEMRVCERQWGKEKVNIARLMRVLLIRMRERRGNHDKKWNREFAMSEREVVWVRRERDSEIMHDKYIGLKRPTVYLYICFFYFAYFQNSLF